MNIVFDLGGVVFDWQPDKLARRVFDNEDAEALVKSEIFGHQDWIELDRGTLSLDEAIRGGVARTGLGRDDVARLFDAVPASLTPISETIELIRSIRATDNRLYVLSNMHHASIDYLERKHDIWDIFDGIVVSSRINMVKPERAIYEYLLKEHELNAPETVFIDDLEENLAAAATFGIRTIRFEDAAQCRRELEGLHWI